MLQIQVFLNLCTQMWEGRNAFRKGICPPLLFLPLAPAWVIFKRHLAKITCPGNYRYTNVYLIIHSADYNYLATRTPREVENSMIFYFCGERTEIAITRVEKNYFCIVKI